MSLHAPSSTSHLSIPSTSALSSSSGRAKSPTHPVLGSAPTTPPRVLRSHSHSHSSPSQSLIQSLSLPPTPLHTPQVSSTHVFRIEAPRRLLMPTVRSTRSGPPRGSFKLSSAKISRTRAGSVTTSGHVSSEQSESQTPDWIGGKRRLRFEIVEEQLELEGFQIYAVEKWIVERCRPVTVVTVFTGDPTHKITVTALSPCSTLTQAEAQSEWKEAITHLRREGARPKETAKGVLMVTSLANFRSDFTIVHIPLGNFLDVREQLYTNINILRMGCSGRSALTLEEPSDATKDRFISMYSVPDKASSRAYDLFNNTVLELVKLVQSSLSMFGMINLESEEKNGLLCDVTCKGIEEWIRSIGEPYMKVEHMERVADPAIVSALFSLIFTVRNKLQALGHVVPKDPFLDSSAFTKALVIFLASKPHGHGHSHSLSVTASPLPSTTASPNLRSSSPSAHVSPVPSVVFLTLPLIESIQYAYEKKMRSNESYKVHRVLINKLDDLATDLRTTGVDSAAGGAASNVNPTTDLEAFVKVIVSSHKDSPQSLRYLWTGRPGEAGKKRRGKETVWSDAEREREERERDGDGERTEGRRYSREKDGPRREGRDREKKVSRDREKDKEERTSDDEGDAGNEPWSGKVQRKIESWAGLGRGKKLSVDFGTLSKALGSPDSPTRGHHSEQSSTVPSVVISRDPADEEDILSSGQVSPVSDSTPNPLMLGFGHFGDPSGSDVSDYRRRMIDFDRKRPSTRPTQQSRITSWSDPVSARGLLDDDAPIPERDLKPLEEADDLQDQEETDRILKAVERQSKPHRRKPVLSRSRRRSFDDAVGLQDARILPPSRMRIDVELCGQLLVMQRREAHLANVAACLEALAGSLSRTNSRLRQDHESARPLIEGLYARAEILHDLEAAQAKTDALTQETNALNYESAQFLVDDLWHMAAAPRRRVLDLREKAFGTGRNLPQGVRGAHGRFTQVQWTLTGEGRLVDRLGRTESEAEEEESLPALPGMDMEEEADVDAVEHQTLRPTWLLRFFNYWGSKWGASKGTIPAGVKAEIKDDKVDDDGFLSVKPAGSTTSLPTMGGQQRVRPVRNLTT